MGELIEEIKRAIIDNIYFLQDIHNRDFNDSAEEEAAYYADALVGKFLQNRRKNGIHIDGVLTVWEPPEEDA